jgi:carboxyl-terminal processing protease
MSGLKAAFLLCLGLCLSNAAVAQTAPVTAPTLYHKVWELVARNNYDPAEISHWAEKEHEFDATFTEAGMNEAYAALLMPMIRSPYAKLLDADDMKALNEKFEAQKASIDISFPEDWGNQALFSQNARTNEIPVKKVGYRSTAATAGLVVGDRLIAINGIAISAIDIDKIAGTLEGDVGSVVALTVIHNGDTRTVAVKRELIVDHGTTFDNKTPGVESIELSTFVPDTTIADVRAAFDQGEKARVIKLNLRNDHGGRLENAIGVASMFVKKGVLLKIRSRVDSDIQHPKYIVQSYEVTDTELLKKEFDETTGKTTIIARAPREPYRLNHRTVVLAMNGQTASASELVIGAIKDHAGTVNGAEKLTIVGERSFGKGIGQSIFEGLPEGYGLVLTTFRYLSPKGYWVGDGDSHRKGFTPTLQSSDVTTQNRLIKKAVENELHSHRQG